MADELGVCVLLKSLTSFENLREGYVNALTSTGERRFRWPESGSITGLGAIGIGVEGTLWVAQEVTDPESEENTVIFHIIDRSSGNQMDRFILSGLELPSRFPNFFQLTDEVGLISAIPDGVFAHIIVAFDIHTRQLLPIDFSNLVSSTCIGGFALSSDGRLFILYDDPWRIEVLKDWKRHTEWALERLDRAFIPFPARIALDSADNLSFITREITVSKFEP